MAVYQHRTSAPKIPLSSLIRDPFVRAAFERAERGPGFSFAVSASPRPVLIGGAAVKRELANV